MTQSRHSRRPTRRPRSSSFSYPSRVRGSSVRPRFRSHPRPRIYDQRVVNLAGYKVKLIRKNVRNVYLRIKGPDQTCGVTHPEVTAPRTAPTDVLERFVASHRTWIDTTLAKYEAVQREGKDQADKWTSEKRLQASHFLRQYLTTALSKWTAIVGRKPTNISLRVMKTRWGSCTPATGRIRLNLELADMPERLIEYVLVHELTHLRASGHGPKFQHFMDMYMPDWRERRKEINRRILM